jgi:predicted aspartyl protease
LLIGLAPIDANAASKCALKQIAWLDFALTKDGRPTIDVKLGGRGARLIIDTGSSFSLIDQSMATALKLTPKSRSAPADLGNGNGAGELPSARIPSVQLGAVELGKAYDFFIYPNGRAEWGSGVSGTIGVNVLQDIDLELDMARRKAGFYSQKHCRGKVVYWAGEWFEIPMKRRRGSAAVVLLDGRQLTATVDTGSSHSILDLDAATKVFGLTPGGKSLQAEATVSVGGRKIPGFRGRFGKLVMGGFEVHGASIRVADIAGTDIILGMQHLQYLHLYFAYGEDKVYATGAHATFVDPGRQATRAPTPIVK